MFTSTSESLSLSLSEHATGPIPDAFLLRPTKPFVAAAAALLADTPR